jgi:hypothetical protein
MLEKPLQPGLIKRGEEVADISVEYPVHLSLRDPDRERIQRIVRAAPGSEPVQAEKILLVDGVQHLDHRPLDDLVLQVAMRSGRCRPSGLGMYTGREGLAR